jgi:hypothetical protein
VQHIVEYFRDVSRGASWSHGWLHDKIGIGERQARCLIRIFDAFGNGPAELAAGIA